jgi:hypothetical protein
MASKSTSRARPASASGPARRGGAKPSAKSPAADAPAAAPPRFVVERVQTGFRMEKRMLKVLKAVAEYHDMALGDLVEGIVLHAFEGSAPFGEEGLRRIADFKRLYGLELDASAAHRLTEEP